MAIRDEVIQAAPWYKISAALAAASFCGAAFVLFYLYGLGWLAPISVLLLMVGMLAVYEVFSTRIVLSDSSMDIVSLLGKRSFERSRISTVKVDGGSVFIKIEGGGWVKLPELGRNSLSVSNTIRAWLRRG